MYTGFWRGNLEGRDQIEDLVVDGMIILKQVLKEIGREDVDWFDLKRDWDKLL